MNFNTLHQCAKCEKRKPAGEFHRQSKSKSGLQNWCKECACKRSREHYEENRERKLKYASEYRKQNKDRIRKYVHEYYEENREHECERAREHYEENREHGLKVRSEYYKANKERLRKVARKWAEENKERMREYQRKYRALKYAAEGTHTFEEIWQMREDQDHLCAYCEIPLFGEMHVEHMVPLSCGGRDDWTNLAIACPTCNQSKRTKTAEEFMEYRLSTMTLV